MASNDLLSLAEVKDVLEVSTIDHDEELAGLITGVSNRIDSMCGPVVQRTVTGEKHDGGRPFVVLDKRYGTSASSVVEYDTSGNSTTLSAETESTKTADDYLLDDVGDGVTFLRRRRSGSDFLFAAGRRNVVVTYTAGRVADTASVDELFKRAAALFITHLWKQTAPSYYTDQDFLSEVQTSPRVPGFGIPNAVKDLLADEMRGPVVG